jgi:hypothetical protein
MVSIQVRGHIGADGVLRLQVPTTLRETEVEAYVMVHPVGANGKLALPVAQGWPPGFFEATAGQWVGEIERGEQGEYETRDTLE